MGVLPYRQPPVRSPISVGALRRAVWQADANGGEGGAALRELLCGRYGADRVELVGSGTHALTLALRAVKRARPGRPVLLPAYTCFEVATAAVGADVPVALYDLDPLTLEPDWDAVRRAAGGSAAAIVVAPLYGMVVDWDAAQHVAAELGALLIEDAAQAHGSSWDGRPAGSVGDFAVLSFGRGKGWTAAAGGAVLARGPAAGLLDTTAELVPQSGTTRLIAAALAQWLLARPALYGVPASIPALHLGETLYHQPTPPRAMPAFSSALALANDRAAQAEAGRRRAAALDYQTRLESEAPATLCGRIRHPKGIAGALRFPVRVAGGWQAARTARTDHLGVGAPYPATLADLPDLRPLLRNPATRHPAAERLVCELVTLPTHSGLSELHRRKLVGWVAERRPPVAPAQQWPAGAASAQSS